MTPSLANTTNKRIKRILLVTLLIIISCAVIYLSLLLPIITGYAAKNLCSDVFISGRKQEEVESTDLNFSFIKYTRNKIDYRDSSVTSRFLWGKSMAICRKHFGTVLLRKCTEDEIRSIHFPSFPGPDYSKDTVDWPLGDIITDTLTGFDRRKLESVSSSLVQNDNYGGDAFAFMVLYKGIPVIESYKPQFDKNTRFLSWSMAKSVMNAEVGVMVSEGLIDIMMKPDIDNWSENDRSNITLNDLMHMQSGLKWNEDYGNRSDVTVMLHCRNNMAKFAYDKKSEYPAGTHWLYSSGTANIISYIIRKQFNDDPAYYAYLYKDLFYRIGITDAVQEIDPSGTYVGSSYLYATARDFARFGLLFLQDGVVNGVRILPEGWVTYSTTPASCSGGKYGSLFWLNVNGKIPAASEASFMCEGHDGQEILVDPEKKLVVVVLGYSPHGSMDFNRLVEDIYKAF